MRPALFDTGAGMSNMSCNCHSKLHSKPKLNESHILSIYSAIGHDSHPIGIAYCDITLGHTPLVHLFTVCIHLTKGLVIGLDMQQIYHIGCD